MRKRCQLINVDVDVDVDVQRAENLTMHEGSPLGDNLYLTPRPHYAGGI